MGQVAHDRAAGVGRARTSSSSTINSVKKRSKRLLGNEHEQTEAYQSEVT